MRVKMESTATTVDKLRDSLPMDRLAGIYAVFNMIFKFPPLWVVFIALLSGVLPAKAEVWRYVDKDGVLQFSSHRPSIDAAMIFDSAQATSSTSKIPRHTYCSSPCKGTNAEWWLASPKYRSLEAHLAKAARLNGVDLALLKAVAATESAFNTMAVSRKGAIGVMQVMPATARMYGVRGARDKDVADELKNPETNIDVAAQHLSRLLKVYRGRLDLVLAAYNAGESAVAKAAGKVPDFPETKQYVSNVMYLYSLTKSQAA